MRSVQANNFPGDYVYTFFVLGAISCWVDRWFFYHTLWCLERVRERLIYYFIEFDAHSKYSIVRLDAI